MGKRGRRTVVKTADAAESQDSAASLSADATPQVGPREPCPCGSGRRYKNCHGGSGGGSVYVARPFAGLAGERDVIAMREFVPSATAPLTLREGIDPHPETRTVLCCTLLPMASPALVRPDGSVWLGLQVQHGSDDISRDLAYALQVALTSQPGQAVTVTTMPRGGVPSGGLPGGGPRLQDLLEPAAAFDVTVHEGFDFWVADLSERDGATKSALERADAVADPTVKLDSVEAAYWTQQGKKEFLRWVMAEPEEDLLDGLARLHVAGEDRLTDGSRLIGSFRAHGLLVPVWEFEPGTGARSVDASIESFAAKLAAALERTEPLTGAERKARVGLATRQLTVR